ncbi:MAG: radical SAM protein [Anaerolineae bacterium]|nr:radical SAM protein [Anaerolineae bacterium]
MRVLFVEKQIDYEPQGIMSMAAVLRKAGHEVALTVATREDPVEFARRYRPHIVGYSVLTGSQRAYFDLNRRIKAALAGRVFSVFGGPHPTFFPEMVKEPGVDGICIGEGEGAIVDLANSLAENGADDGGELRPRPDILNWWFKFDGDIVRNPVRPLIHDLSSLPLPDRTLVYDKQPTLRSSPIKHFMAGRGCPFNCTYCFNHAFYQIYEGEPRGLQRRVAHVIEEVNWVRERYPLEHVVFLDDVFVLNRRWLEEFAARWPREVGLSFFCNVRANLIARRPEIVSLLKQAGCTTVSMGVETANDRIRNELLQRHMSRQEMVETGRLFKEAGIHLTTTNMLGLPTGTLEDDMETMRLNAQVQASYAHAFLFQPYPGTELGQFTLEQGYMNGTFEDISSVAWDRSILIFPSELEKRQVEHLQRLFALGVEWPRLEPLIRRLIRLPHNRLVDGLFWWVHKLFKGYIIYHRVHPIRTSLLDLLRNAAHFLRLEA